MTELIVPAQWHNLRAEMLHGTVLIVGASDTGKSTLARYLFQALCRHGQRAAYLDTDVGQSTLGLPTTLDVALAATTGDERFPPQGLQRAYFAGAVTPRRHLLPTVVGAHRLQQEALARGAGAIVVDTSGLVDREQGGKALKQWLIELLAPSLVIGLQRDRELEPILWPLRRDDRLRCIELPVSPHVVARSRQERIERRRERLAGYFAPAKPRRVNLRQQVVYDIEQLAVHALLALQDAEGFVRGLGAVQELDRQAGTAIVRTPLPDLDGVASLRLGAARWDVANRREA